MPAVSRGGCDDKADLGRGCAVTRPVQESTDAVGSAEVGSRIREAWPGDGIPSGGQNPANGVMLYSPAGDKAGADLATCTLPDAAAPGVHCGARPLRRAVRLSAPSHWVTERTERGGRSLNYSGVWQTASTLFPSGSRTNAP